MSSPVRAVPPQGAARSEKKVGLVCAKRGVGRQYWSDGRVARQRSAKPYTAVRIRFRPHRNRVVDACNAVQIHYPAFFEQVPDSLIHETGCCQFYFGNMLKIAQTAFIVTNLDGFTVRQGMEHFAMEQHATERRCGNDYFLLSGPLYINHRPVEGYRFYAKYVQRQKLWFVQSLSYPASCTRAVSRLIEQIDNWQVWE